MDFVASHPNRYVYRGVLYHTIDLFFHAAIPEFGRAQALDAVAELIIAPVPQVRPDDFAFTSMAVAWRTFLQRRSGSSVV